MTSRVDAVSGQPFAALRPRALENQMAIHFALPACRRALEIAQCKPEEIDLIVSKAVSPSHIADAVNIVGPRIGHPIQRELRACNAFVFDLLNADWAFAVETACGFFDQLKFRRALIVHAECTGPSVVSDDHSGFALADGAGALVIAPKQSASVALRPSYVELRHPYRGARIELLKPEVSAHGPARVQLRFEAVPGLVPALQAAGAEALGAQRKYCGGLSPDLYSYERWLPGFEISTSALDPRHLCQPVETEGLLGPYTLPAVIERCLENGESGSLLGLSFDPFTLRFGCVPLSFQRHR